MMRATRWLAAVAMLVALAPPARTAAQQAELTFDNPTVRILQNYTLRAGDTAQRVVVVGADARIEGTVTEDVVVVLGKLELASTAVIEGSLVVSAGSVEIADGAKVGRDFVVIGGARTPPDFRAGGQHVVIGTAGLGDSLRELVPWLTRGLLLGRPIVPWLGWVWVVAGVFFFLNFCLNLLFDAPVRLCATTLRTTPFSALIAGLLVLLLIGPVCMLLAISVIGIVVVPFVLCALLVCAVLGRIGFARWIGMSVFPQSDPADRGQSTRSFLIGSALMCVTYMIPFVGLTLWILAGVFGLGAATLAFYGAYRRENPRPPKKSRVAPPVPDGPAPPATPLADPSPMEPAVAERVDLQPEGGDLPRHGGDLPPEGGSYLPQGATYLPQDLVGYPKGTFVERLAALVLDTIVIFIVMRFFDFDRDYGGMNERLLLVLALSYHVGFWVWRGTTLGGMICQLRVVRVDGRKLEFAESLIRGITGIISLAVVGLGFLWILRDPERQGWHDRVAGTYVVKVPRSYPI